MSNQKDCRLGKILITNDRDGIDHKSAIISTYFLSKLNELFVSSLVVGTAIPFKRGIRIIGDKQWFNLPESRLRIDAHALFQGRFESETRNVIERKGEFRPWDLDTDGESFRAFIADVPSYDQIAMASFGGFAAVKTKRDPKKDARNGGGLPPPQKDASLTSQTGEKKKRNRKKKGEVVDSNAFEPSAPFQSNDDQNKIIELQRQIRELMPLGNTPLATQYSNMSTASSVAGSASIGVGSIEDFIKRTANLAIRPVLPSLSSIGMRPGKHRAIEFPMIPPNHEIKVIDLDTSTSIDFIIHKQPDSSFVAYRGGSHPMECEAYDCGSFVCVQTRQMI